MSLSGVFPVLPTPFDAGNRVDPAALARLVDFALEAGVDGVVYPGMASEVETLSPEERLAMVEAVGARLAGRKPFIVGASDADPARAAARAEEGRKAGAVAAMIMAPVGLGQDVAAHAAFYNAVAAGTRLPVMLQNAPQPMGAGLGAAAVAAIAAACPAIRFIKEETLPCGQNVSAHLDALGGRLDGVFGGAGARYIIDELRRGAAGTMPALELADLHVALVAAWRAGDRAKARALYAGSLPLLLFQAVFRVRMTKAVLKARGLLAATHARAAGPKLDAHDEAELAELISGAAGLFTLHQPRSEAVHAPA